MRRKAAIVVALVGLVLAAAIGGGGNVRGAGARHRDEPDDLGRLDRSGAERVQEGGGRVRRQERGCDRQGRRRHRRPQDHRRPPLGHVPDVVSSFTSQNVGVYCPSGGWIDLAPYLKRDKINVNIFPATTRYYTQYGGTRCALPLLADVYGFYYNKELFKKAGLTRPRARSRSSRRMRRS